VFSSLRDSKYGKVNGLLAIALPSVIGADVSPRARVDENVVSDPKGKGIGYARWRSCPTYSSTVRSWINDAYAARTQRAPSDRQHEAAATQ
jgi:hypothetical protein